MFPVRLDTLSEGKNKIFLNNGYQREFFYPPSFRKQTLPNPFHLREIRVLRQILFSKKFTYPPVPGNPYQTQAEDNLLSPKRLKNVAGLCCASIIYSAEGRLSLRVTGNHLLAEMQFKEKTG